MDHPTTLIEFMELYPTEEDCSAGDLRAPLAAGLRVRALRARRMPGTCAAAVCIECAHCHYQGSLTAGTIFSRTRTDLRKWLLAIWLLASTKKAPSAAELARQLGVTAKTAWLLRRKITHAMARREGELLLRGIVELDEGFLGGQAPAADQSRTSPARQDDGRRSGGTDARRRLGLRPPVHRCRCERGESHRRRSGDDRRWQHRADRRLERLRRP